MVRTEVPKGLGDGDEGFPGFVRANYVALVRYGASLVGDRGRAEDIVQLALVKVCRAWARIDPERREAYTRTVMARLAWRQGRRRWSGEIPSGDRLDLAGDAHDQFAAVDDDDAVRRALDRLPPRQRVVLTLRYLDELSEEETARALGCAVGTVKSRAARGIETLRHSGLEPEGGRTQRRARRESTDE